MSTGFLLLLVGAWTDTKARSFSSDLALGPAIVQDPPEELGLPPRAPPALDHGKASAAAAALRAELGTAGPVDLAGGGDSCAVASRAGMAAEGHQPVRSCGDSGAEPSRQLVSVTTFPARLVAEQLTFMDAVRGVLGPPVSPLLTYLPWHM